MNERKFTGKGEIYSRSRPVYPPALFELLAERGIVGKTKAAADIGAGTGIFTAQLAPWVGQVYAVEPNDDMRRASADIFRSAGNIISVKASAEETTLDDSSADLITAAQAFHWFDKSRFAAECRRILREGGMVLLVWNDRDTRSSVITENYEVNRRFCPEFKGSSNGFEFSTESFADFFSGDFETIELPNVMYYDEETFVSRCLSSSYAPKEGDLGFDEYVAAIRDIFSRHSSSGMVEYPYITRCYLGVV